MAIHNNQKSGVLRTEPVSPLSLFSEVVISEGSKSESLARRCSPCVEGFLKSLAVLFKPILLLELVPRHNGVPVKLCFNAEAAKFAPNMVVSDQNILLSYSRVLAHEFESTPHLSSLTTRFRQMLKFGEDFDPLFRELGVKTMKSSYWAVYYSLFSLALFYLPSGLRERFLVGVSQRDVQVLLAFYRTYPDYLNMVRAVVQDFVGMVSLQHRQCIYRGM